MTTNAFSAIVLAAGKGTRMKSATPKVLHEVAGLSMVGHVLRTVEGMGAAQVTLVTSPDQDEVRTAAAALIPNLVNAVQEQQLGTADAVKSAMPGLEHADLPVIVLYGDTPLVRAETLNEVVATARNEADIAVLGFRAGDPTGYGRLLLDSEGHITGIREQMDATEEERAIDLCNSGVMALTSRSVLDLIAEIGNDNAKGEYYLTDLVEVAREKGLTARVVECPEEETLGVNSRVQLAEAEAVMQQRLRAAAMEGGVTMISPETVYLRMDTVIGSDVTIEPNVVFGAGVKIGSGVTILGFCHMEGAEIEDGAIIGPYARFRPGPRLGPGTKVGNFVEIKNAVLEVGAKVNHLSYVGDARVGERANVGAGTITCNYDGFKKHHTDIGAGSFIGSNSALVAPVTIGDGAYIGSGSVITKDVAPDALALSRAPQQQKDGWAERVRSSRNKK